MNDRRLLSDYVAHGSQAAFAEITHRYLKLVYSTCFRELANRELAEDATQAVFLLVASKATSLVKHQNLAGWMFHASRLASQNARRQERRRTARDERTARLMDSVAVSRSDAGMIDAVLNDALASLGAADREAILLRYFSEYSLSETGQQLGISEDGARKRIGRALEKLRGHLAKHGAVLSTVAVTTYLGAHATQAATETCRAAVVSIGQSVVGGHVGANLAGAHVLHLTKGVIRQMAMTKITMAAVVVAATVVLGIGGRQVATAVAQNRAVAASLRSSSFGSQTPQTKQLIDASILAINRGNVPDIVKLAVTATVRGDFSPLAARMTSAMTQALTPQTIQSAQQQVLIAGSVTALNLESTINQNGFTVYSFAVQSQHGAMHGKLTQDASTKIAGYYIFTDASADAGSRDSGLVATMQPAIQAAVNAAIAGDFSTLQDQLTPQMSAALTPQVVSAAKSQISGLGAMTNIGDISVSKFGDMTVSSFTVTLEHGTLYGRLTKDASGKIAGFVILPRQL